RMFRRGSPRMNLIQAAAMQRVSPRSTTNKRKKRTSPKVGRLRANWNSGLEKDKEKELKRDYKALKEARQQSGVSWDERLCRIEAKEPIWNNLTTSNERLKKFRTKSFPLFEALGELHDGNIAEGTMNFTSIEPSRPPVTQPCQGAATHPSQAAFTLTQPFQPAFTQPSQPAFTQPSQAAFTQPSQAAFVSRDERKQDEVEKRVTTNANEDDFPTTTCIAIVDGMEELSDDEKNMICSYFDIILSNPFCDPYLLHWNIICANFSYFCFILNFKYENYNTYLPPQILYSQAVEAVELQMSELKCLLVHTQNGESAERAHAIALAHFFLSFPL
ncbi:hypothetical protein ACJX0J_019188, partial [Zea mays]